MREPKSEGITYLRYAINAQKKRSHSKFVTIPMDKAEEIIKQSKGFVPSNSGYDARRNSERAAALILGLDVKDLVKKLSEPDVAKVLSELAEAKNKIKMYEDIGDRMHERLRVLSYNDSSLRKEWLNARKGF